MLGRLVDAFVGLIARLSPGDLTIRYRPGRPIEVRGRVSRAKAAEIAEFFGRDLKPDRAATVRGSIGRGRLHLRFSGGIGPGQRQRVRNFLVDLLL